MTEVQRAQASPHSASSLAKRAGWEHGRVNCSMKKKFKKRGKEKNEHEVIDFCSRAKGVQVVVEGR